MTKENELGRIVLNGNVLYMYTSIEYLPFTQFVHYNKYALVDSGFPTDLNGINDKITLCRKLNLSNDKEDVNKLDVELFNLSQSLQNTVKTINFQSLSFVCLIKSINDKSINDKTDFSQESINELLYQLSKKGLTVGKIQGFLAEVKKKFDFEFEAYFPEPNFELIKHTKRLESLNDALYKYIVGKDTKEKIKRIEDELFKSYKPQMLAGKSGAIMTYNNSVYDSYNLINEHSTKIAQEMTTFEYYKYIEHLKKKFKPK